ncbi:MAG: type II secretion system protein [Elusimicrobia bacterium]|nr:type II secretion system protein [Elusimicrobiota bacterium]MDE2237152.1 type II secretion system protein [Elusimicrobiota bacterium]MDE2424912.1 type II secretion system protein [Elusimicrobiota bacterium]
MEARGYTLVEVVVSILLTAVMVSAIFSVALSSRQGGGKAERKMLANGAAQALSDALKGYVSGDYSGAASAFGINGPSPGSGAATWYISTANQVDHNCSGPASAADSSTTIYGPAPRYALAAGCHALVCQAGAAQSECFMPAKLRASPYNGYIYYTVSYPAGSSAPLVQVFTYWSEP